MNLAPEIIKEVFEIVEGPYSLRNELNLKSKKIHSVRYGSETASFVGARIWNSLPSDLKECNASLLGVQKTFNDDLWASCVLSTYVLCYGGQILSSLLKVDLD